MLHQQTKRLNSDACNSTIFSTLRLALTLPVLQCFFSIRTWQFKSLSHSAIADASQAADWLVLVQVHHQIVGVGCPARDALVNVPEQNLRNQDVGCDLAIPAEPTNMDLNATLQSQAMYTDIPSAPPSQANWQQSLFGHHNI